MALPAKRRRKRLAATDPLDAYRRIRKPMPPPERVIPDKRQKLVDQEAEREAQEAGSEP